MAASQTGAALMGLSAPANSPYYADFELAGLSFTETYDSADQTATLRVATRGIQTEHYTSSSQSPRTHGSRTLSPQRDNGFRGSLSLTASIRYENGNWILESGSFTVYENLAGGIGHRGDMLLHGRNRHDILLHGNLEPGISGPDGTFRYWTSGTESKGFEFLYTAVTSQKTTVQGAMILDVTSSGWGWKGDWSDPWHGSAFGVGALSPLSVVPDPLSVVPEPSAYGWLGAGLAAAALVVVRRTPRNMRWSAASNSSARAPAQAPYVPGSGTAI
jgi:hypothetical protein